MRPKVKAWLVSLETVVVHSLAVTIAANTVAPSVFTFSKTGLLNTLMLVLVPTIHALCLKLSESPLPAAEEDEKKSRGVAIEAVIAVVLGLGCLISWTPAHGQSAANFYAAGGSYNPGASPAIAGTGLYAHRAVSTGANSSLFAFTMVDALPSTVAPYTVTTNLSVGVAQQVASIAGMDVLMPTGAGLTVTGSNTGWNWSTGAALVIPVPSKPGWYVLPTVRVLKSSVSSGTGYQPILGVLFGWGR